MAQYSVILKGIADESQEGRGAFYEKFGRSYGMSADQARDWIERRAGRIYAFDDQAAAVKARDFLLQLGATAEVVEEGVAEILDLGPGPAAPATAPATEASGRPCPKCGALVPAGRDDCPSCQVFISKYEQMMARKAAASATGAAAPGYGAYQGQPGQPGGGGYHSAAAQAKRYGQGWRLGYLRPYNLSDMMGDVADLYKDNFMTLFLLKLIPMGIGLVAMIMMVIVGSREPSAAVVVVLVLFGVPAFCILTYISYYFSTASVLAVSEAMHGGRPDLMRTIKSVNWTLPLKMMITLLIPALMLALPLVLVMIAASLLHPIVMVAELLILPLIFVLAANFLLVMPIVVLENTWGFPALYRSIDLGKGYYWRNLGMFALFIIILFVITLVASLILVIIPFIGTLASWALRVAIMPISNIVMVMLYFEMRTRKEGYTGHAAAAPAPASREPAPAYSPHAPGRGSVEVVRRVENPIGGRNRVGP